MCLAAFPPSLQPVVASSTNVRAVPPEARTWRKMLSSVDRQVTDGVQSFTVALLLTPDVMPMYCVRLDWVVFVSVQSANTEHRVASECRYGIDPKPTPPTVAQRRFSLTITTTC